MLSRQKVLDFLRKKTQDVSAIQDSSGRSVVLRSPTYQPIANHESRLLHLLPGKWEDPIAFNLVVFSTELESLPFYEAVSYTWGDQRDGIPVTCSGRDIDVTVNVAALLRRFRLLRDTRLLWIDAVCINQMDNEEKSIQVAMMDIIYRRANRVLIFLGEADATSDLVMSLFALRFDCRHYNLKIFTSFLESRPWFNRIWVLQEVALAEHALAICGSKCIPWACIPAWWAINKENLRYSSGPPPTLSIDPIALKRSSLLQQLHDNRSSRATNPCDKVYGLLGLLSPEEKLGVLVDYAQPFETVYKYVVTFIMTREKSLKALSAVVTVNTHDRPQGSLPSWVPDWQQDVSLISLGLSNMYLEPYDSGGSVACGLHISDDLLQLSCLGINLDVVESLGEVCPFKAPILEGKILPTLNQWWHLLNGTLETRSSKLRRRSSKVIRNPISYKPDMGIWCQVRSPDSMLSSFLYTLVAQPSPTLQLHSEVPSQEAKPKLSLDAVKFCLGRRLVITKTGLIGLAPPEAKSGDIVVVLIGAPVPHILRKQGNRHVFIGECYVHGVMGGEALGHLSEELKSLGHRCRPCPKSKSDARLERFLIE